MTVRQRIRVLCMVTIINTSSSLCATRPPMGKTRNKIYTIQALFIFLSNIITYDNKSQPFRSLSFLYNLQTHSGTMFAKAIYTKAFMYASVYYVILELGWAIFSLHGLLWMGARCNCRRTFSMSKCLWKWMLKNRSINIECLFFVRLKVSFT